MYSIRLAFRTLVISLAAVLRLHAADMEPAIIGQRSDSVASNLHYPAAAKSSKAEAAVQFYCEIGRDGQARHTRVIATDPHGPFRVAVQKALAQGRFTPARVGGKNTAVMAGGTVLFLSAKGAPTIVVSLSTAEKARAASGQNYIQPQVLMDYHEFEQKCILFARGANLGVSSGPGADVAMDVDASGNTLRSRVVGENAHGWGDLALKAFAGAKFIPARLNGKPVSGQFNYAVDFRMIAEREQTTGSHLKPRDEY